MKTSPAIYSTLSSSAEAYAAACRLISEAFDKVAEARKLMAPTYEYAVDTMRIGPLDNPAGAIKELTRKSWREIIKKTGLYDAITPKRREEIDKQIEEDKMPPLTVESLHEIVGQLVEKGPELMTESIRATFEILTPRREKYKTNSAFMVGKKAILPGVLQPGYAGSMRVSRWRGCDSSVQTVDRSFHLLDGKGVPHYPNDLLTKIEEACHQNSQFVETDYFKCGLYRNGNLHIEFKRLDLVEKLNAIGSNGAKILRKA